MKINFVSPYEGQCLGKQPFETRTLAEKAVRHMNQMGKNQHAYLCPHCRKFHHGTNRTKINKRNAIPR